MDSTRLTAGRGLYFLFVGQIVSLLFFIPLLGVIAALAGAAISIYGFYILSQATADYKNAFVLTLAGIVLSILKGFFSTGIIGFALTSVSSLFSFCVVYFVCTSTANLLYGIDQTQVNRAGLIWKLYGLCTLVTIICSVLAAIPLINLLAGFVNIVITIVQIVASVLYLVFLWNCQKILH